MVKYSSEYFYGNDWLLEVFYFRMKNDIIKHGSVSISGGSYYCSSVPSSYYNFRKIVPTGRRESLLSIEYEYLVSRELLGKRWLSTFLKLDVTFLANLMCVHHGWIRIHRPLKHKSEIEEWDERGKWKPQPFIEPYFELFLIQPYFQLLKKLKYNTTIYSYIHLLL